MSKTKVLVLGAHNMPSDLTQHLAEHDVEVITDEEFLSQPVEPSRSEKRIALATGTRSFSQRHIPIMIDRDDIKPEFNETYEAGLTARQRHNNAFPKASKKKPKNVQKVPKIGRR